MGRDPLSAPRVPLPPPPQCSWGSAAQPEQTTRAANATRAPAKPPTHPGAEGRGLPRGTGDTWRWHLPFRVASGEQLLSPPRQLLDGLAVVLDGPLLPDVSLQHHQATLFVLRHGQHQCPSAPGMAVGRGLESSPGAHPPVPWGATGSSAGYGMAWHGWRGAGWGVTEQLGTGGSARAGITWDGLRWPSVA